MACNSELCQLMVYTGGGIIGNESGGEDESKGKGSGGVGGSD